MSAEWRDQLTFKLAKDRIKNRRLCRGGRGFFRRSSLREKLEKHNGMIRVQVDHRVISRPVLVAHALLWLAGAEGAISAIHHFPRSGVVDRRDPPVSRPAGNGAKACPAEPAAIEDIDRHWQGSQHTAGGPHVEGIMPLWCGSLDPHG
ncbi:hypothetical protein [Sphingomonas sp. RT2P30]|uniref:hypothetical protein n=1 Tax=Parasphingomonas halimpatiens TaxID=3096162 RepID=UPI002FC73E1A